jgi:hypothetical protein
MYNLGGAGVIELFGAAGSRNCRHTAATSQLHSYHSALHSAVCLTTGPQPLPEPLQYTVRSRASSFNLQYPLISLTWSTWCPLDIVVSRTLRSEN